MSDDPIEKQNISENGVSPVAPDKIDKPLAQNNKADNSHQNDNLLHGMSLKNILIFLVEHYDWEGLSRRIDIRCFYNEPSISSSLKFLRKTPWARKQVEGLYVYTKKNARPF